MKKIVVIAFVVAFLAQYAFSIMVDANFRKNHKIRDPINPPLSEKPNNLRYAREPKNNRRKFKRNFFDHTDFGANIGSNGAYSWFAEFPVQ